MKILYTGDWHGDAVTGGVRRFPEVERAVGKMVDRALDEKVDLFLFGGDLCDPDSGSCVFRVVNLAERAAVRLAHGGVRSLWVAGNHDTIEDGSGETTLEPLKAVGEAFEAGKVRVADEPGHLLPYAGRIVVPLPFTPSSHPYDPVKVVDTVPVHEGAMPVVVVGHLTVPGIQPGEETTDMPRGREVTFPLDAIVKRPDRDRFVLLNAHYHRQQVTTLSSGLVMHVPGSPARFTFGEEWNEPGFLILDIG